MEEGSNPFFMQTHSEILENKGIRPSVQRVRIFKFLMQSKEHPTVEMIFNALLPEMPSLSRTTVYNTVELFKEVGLVQVLDFGRGVLRYDADLSPHSHFECERCGAVYDLDIKPQDISKKMPRGFKVHQTYFYVFGLCSHCKKNEKN